MKGILGRKLEMSQVFDTNGKLIPVTIVSVEPNTVLQVKTIEKDGYNSIKIGVFDKRTNLVNKPELGAFKKANSAPKRFIKEIRDVEQGYEIGNVIKFSDIFNAGEFIDATGISKGKGFAGAIKRHNYSRGPMGHGSGYHRGIGSMGAIINRIFKSKKMAGHMGHEQVTIQNLEIIKIDESRNLVLIKGSIPGPKNGYIIIKQNVKGKKTKDEVELLQRNVKQTQKVEEAPKAAEEKVEAPTPVVEQQKEAEVVKEATAEPVVEETKEAEKTAEPVVEEKKEAKTTEVEDNNESKENQE